ncbi:MAG: MerC family mercury resistance protein [Culicoidibacterales bacterium]
MIVQDVLGISSACICLIHCIVFPLLSVLPIGIAHNPWIDVFFFGIAAVLIFKILKSEAPFYIKITLLFFLFLVLNGMLLDFALHQETYLVPIGGIGIIVGHVLHYFYHQKK